MKQLEKEYPVVLSQDVIWGDMDAFGHINNTVYFRYFEDARIAYFDKIGVHEQKKQFDTGPILARTHCNFRLPLDYPDRIHIAARSNILSPKKEQLTREEVITKINEIRFEMEAELDKSNPDAKLLRNYIRGRIATCEDLLIKL